MTSRAQNTISPLLIRYLAELGYACWTMSGVPLPPLERSQLRDEVIAVGPPPGHPERLSTAPPTKVERRLWRQLRRTRAARGWPGFAALRR
ncbi:DUF6059 family protein [Micromonospora sp. NPDC002575]|uniref:DUF6059 family protein n=1 Tax=Micromonospora sp. NPDC002575 TaxID=3364222 RepID=UPI0036ACF989